MRANALAALYVRARVEGGVRFSVGASRTRWKALGARLAGWAREADGVDAVERRALLKPLGAWTDRAVTDASWCLESAGFLLWTVRMQRLRPWSRAYGPDLLPWVDTPSWVNEGGPRTKGRPAPRRRSADELEEMLDRAEAWHWRAVTAQRPGSSRIDGVVRDAARAAESRGFFRAKDDDFPYGGRPYRSLSGASLAAAHSIALERHRAVAWVQSTTTWARVRVDT